MLNSRACLKYDIIKLSFTHSFPMLYIIDFTHLEIYCTVQYFKASVFERNKITQDVNCEYCKHQGIIQLFLAVQYVFWCSQNKRTNCFSNKYLVYWVTAWDELSNSTRKNSFVCWKQLLLNSTGDLPLISVGGDSKEKWYKKI